MFAVLVPFPRVQVKLLVAVQSGVPHDQVYEAAFVVTAGANPAPLILHKFVLGGVENVAPAAVPHASGAAKQTKFLLRFITMLLEY